MRALVEGRSPEKLTEIGVEVVVFSPEGEPKGFYDLPIDAPMEPGGTARRVRIL